MGNIPLVSVLGISMMTFASLLVFAGLKLFNARISTNPNSDAGVGEVFSYMIAIFVGAGGGFIHVINIDTDPAIRSFAFAFVCANIGFGYLFTMYEMEQWLDGMPAAIGTVFVGFVLGLLLSPGDVQKETKEQWRREEAKRKAEAMKSEKTVTEEEKDQSRF